MTDIVTELREAQAINPRRMRVQAADEIERLRAEVERHQQRAKSAERLRDEFRDVLMRNGFVPCDIPACNCGSWHARYGLRERWEEIKDALADAGHPLTNANGNNLLKALMELIASRDGFRAKYDVRLTEAQELRTENERLRAGGCARDQKTTRWCAEAEALRADAERWRWIRQWAGPRAREFPDLPDPQTPEEMDAAIDAARKA